MKWDKIGLRPVTDEIIEEEKIPQEELWMVQAGDDTRGPFRTKDLRVSFKAYSEDFKYAKVCSLNSSKWISIFDSKELQPRTPHLESGQNLLPAEDILVLKDGRILGPFDLDTLKEQVSAKRIKVSDEMSLNNGKHWIRLYQYHAFDRRLRKAEGGELPPLPSENEGPGELILDQAREQNQWIDSLLGTKVINVEKVDNSYEESSGTFKLDVATDMGDFKLKLRELLKSQKFKLGAFMGLALISSLGLIGVLDSSFDDTNPISAEMKRNPRIKNRVKLRSPASSPKRVQQTAGRAPAQSSTRNAPVQRYKPKPRPVETKRNLPKSQIIKRNRREEYEQFDDRDDRMNEELQRELASEGLDPEENIEDDFGEPTPPREEEGYDDAYPEDEVYDANGRDSQDEYDDQSSDFE